MLERFTHRARRVVVLAQEEARMLDHDHIGTEHILLGLLSEGEGVAAKALESLGIALEGVRQQVEEFLGRGQRAPGAHIPFTPRAETVLELSLREASQVGQSFVGTEHLLLGLVGEGTGVASQVLVRLGAGLHRVRQQVLQLLSGNAAERDVGVAEPGRVFVSYRRQDTGRIAGRFADRLVQRLGEDQVSISVASTEVAVDFRDVVSRAVGQCDLLLVMIGRQWVSAAAADGGRRLLDENDLVRLEVEAALDRNIRVIPVLVDGAAPPRAEDLPPSLAALVGRDALHIGQETFRQDALRLAQAIERILDDIR